MINTSYKKRNDGIIIQNNDDDLKKYMRLRNRIKKTNTIEERVTQLEKIVEELNKRIG